MEARNLELDGATEPRKRVNPKLVAKAREAYDANQKKNAASREEKAAQKLLKKGMVEGKVTEFKCKSTDGKKDLVAKNEPTTTDSVNVKKAFEALSEEAFLGIAKISLADLEKVAGSNVLAECTDSKAGDDKLSVKEDK